MSAKEFDAYMAFWYEAIQEFAQLVKPHADQYQSRLYGFVSERLFTLYLYQLRMERPSLRVLEVPVSYRRRIGGQSKVAGTLRGSIKAGLKIMSTFARVAMEAAPARRTG